ncbi:MAG TPA: IclR family transcriptional regulator [Woeseiaceae bacterium]|nr:IclR family transcriptional regulator [Woeseiaceae bacterium]
MRGLDLLERVVSHPASLSQLARDLKLNRSTVHRLASSLVDRGYLRLISGEGYVPGPKLLELGYAARTQLDLPRVARPHIEQLSELTGDAVHLGVLEGSTALYLDKLPGRRRIEIGSRVGERHPLCSTGLGKALLLDSSVKQWREYFKAEQVPNSPRKYKPWKERMQHYAKNGFSFDLEENEDRVRCVGAPVRDETGRIVAAISVSSVAQYMDDQRMQELVPVVKKCAESISLELGWLPHPSTED